MQHDQSNAGVLFGTLRASRKCISEGPEMMKASPRGLPSARKPMRVLRASETPNTPPMPSPENSQRRIGPRRPFKPRRYRPTRANDAVPSRRRPAALCVLEIAARAPPNPFLALISASARRESGPRATPTLTSCQRAGRRPTLRVVPPPSALVQFLPFETRREKTRPRSAANICVGVR